MFKRVNLENNLIEIFNIIYIPLNDIVLDFLNKKDMAENYFD